MSGHVKVNFAGVETLSADVKAQQQQLKDSLERIDSTAKRLYDSWGGEAQAAYAGLQAQWNSASAELEMILLGLSGAVGQGGRDMLDAEMRAKARY